MSIYSTVISTIATSSGGGTSTFIISNITGVYPVGITDDTNAFTSGGLVFSGSNMTIGTSVDGGTNYIQMTAGIGGMAASAGTELVSSGTMIFSNSNGVSFGFNASTLTASHNAFSNTSQLTNYLAPKTHIHGSVSLDLLNMSGATASASNGLTLSLTGPSGVISLNGASGQLTFNEGTFINISQNIRSFTINVTNTSAITSAAYPSANTTKFAGIGTTTASTVGSDLKLTLNTAGLNIGVPAWLTTAATGGGSGAALQGSGTYTQNSGTIQFANSNSMTFGLTENQMTASFSYTQSTHEHPYIGTGESTYYQTSNLSSVFLTTAALSNHSHTQYLTTALETNYTSHTHDYQSTGNYLTTALGTNYTSHTHSQYLTTAMVSQNTSLFVYTSASSLLQHTSATSAITSNALNTSVSGSFQLTANNSLSLDTGYTTHTHNYQSTGDYITTAAQVSHTHGSISTASTAGTAFTYSSASNGLSFSIPSWITTYAVGGGEIDISAGASSDGLASLVFSNSGGVSFGLNGSTITATVKTDYQTSGNYLTTAALSNHSHTQYLTTAMASDAGSLYQLTSDNSLSLGTGYTTHTHEYQSTGNYLTTALATNYTSHTHSQYLTTAALSNHTHSDLYIAKGDSTAYQTSVLSGTFLQTGYTTHTHNYQSTGAYLTTAMLSNMTSVFEYTSHTSAITASALNTSQSSLFQHTSATSAITSNAVNTSVTSAYQLIANSTLSLGTAYTSHTHSNLYIALANSTAYATSVLSNTFQTTGAYLTTAALSNHSHTDYVSNFNAGDYISISKAGQSVSISAINLQATSATSAITASAMNTSERNNYFYTSNNTFLTTAALSNHTHSNLYIALANSTYYQSSNLSSVFQTTGAYLTTAMVSNAGSNFAGTGLTTASTAGSDLVITYNSVGLNLGIPKWVTTGGAGGGIAIAGSGSTETDGTVIFSASNGITFGLSDYTMTASIANNIGSLGFNDSNGVSFGVASTTSNSSTVVTASIAAYIGTATTITTTTGTNLLVTAGTAGLNIAHPDWLTTYTPGAGGGEWTVLSTNAGTDIIISTASDTNTLYHPAFITTYSPGCGAVDWSVSSTAGTDVVISTATDTITFYQPPFITGYTESTHDFTQYVGLTSTAITGGSATIASDRLLINIPSNAGSLGYNDSNGVTFGVASTTSNSSTVVTASIAAYAGTSLSTVSTTGSVLLGGINTAGISLSVPAWLTTAAGGGGVAVIASDATYTSGSVSFRGTNVTINTSAGGQYVDLSVAAPATSSAYTYMQWHNFTGNSTHVDPGQNTIWYSPFELMSPVSASSIQIGMTFNGTSTSAATAQWGLTQDLMLMARHSTDSTRFDSIWSSQNLITLWISGTSSGSLAFNAGTSSSNGSRLVGSYFYGQRIISAAVGSELSKGFYMFAYRQSFSTAAYSALVRSYNPVFVGPLYQAKNFLGAQTNISVGHFPGGRYSVTSAAFPTSIGVSELLKSNDLNVFFVIGASS